MRLFRYRTKVLIGPWRPSFQRAIADAVNARQARYEGDSLKWTVPGEIEVQRQTVPPHAQYAR